MKMFFIKKTRRISFFRKVDVAFMKMFFIKKTMRISSFLKVAFLVNHKNLKVEILVNQSKNKLTKFLYPSLLALCHNLPKNNSAI
jgi:hypothetical protein